MFVNAFSVLKSICEFGGACPVIWMCSLYRRSIILRMHRKVNPELGPDCDKGRKRRHSPSIASLRRCRLKRVAIQQVRQSVGVSHWFTWISTLDCDDSSSLPRFWWPFCRGRPKPWPLSGKGPRGCLDGRSSYALLNARCPPIGPGFSHEVICRRDLGLLLCPNPELSCMRFISRSSISSLR
jgi:hypothetical protein